MRFTLMSLGLILCANSALAQEAELAVLPTLVAPSATSEFPSLFDEFLLTAVQDVTKVPVIGKDDIDAVLGFEKTKELMGCDDVSCMADIGGALGVAKLVHAKVDKLDKGKGNWVITTKLILTAGPTVQSRTSDFVSGDAQALLQAIPNIVRKLMSGGGVGGTAQPQAVTPPPPPPKHVMEVEPTPTSGPVYDESYGGGARIGGLVLLVAGAAVGIAGAAVAITGTDEVNADADDYCSEFGYADSCYDEYRGDFIAATGIGVGIAGAGLVLSGVGQSLYLNGRARAHAANDEAKGYHSLTWLGWLFTGMAVGLPMLDAAMDLEPLGTIGGVSGLVGAIGVWTYTMISDSAYYRSPTTGAQYPMVKMFLLRDRNHQTVPAYGFALDF